MHLQRSPDSKQRSGQEPPALDPVCGMSVDPNKTQHHHTDDKGVTHFFCSAGCLKTFRKSPETYLVEKKPEVAALRCDHQVSALPRTSSLAVAPASVAKKKTMGTSVSVPAAVEFTCPMHPQIVQIGPGACPICGMALEPLVATAEPHADPELGDMRRRLIVSALLTVPLFIVAMAEMIPGDPVGHALGRALGWIELLLATPVVFWGAAPFLKRGIQSVRTGHLNMFTLIALGTLTAYGYSVVALVAPGVFPTAMRHGHGGTVDLYFEAAAVITTLVLVGQVLELHARSRTSDAIRSLLQLAPKTARRIEANGAEEHDVLLAEVVVGDRLRVRAGERVPTDGSVLEGSRRSMNRC